MTQQHVHDLMIGGLAFLCGRLMEAGICQLAEVYHRIRSLRKPVSAPLTIPQYYGRTYHREPTHVEKVSAMLDRLEEVKYDRS